MDRLYFLVVYFLIFIRIDTKYDIFYIIFEEESLFSFILCPFKLTRCLTHTRLLFLVNSLVFMYNFNMKIFLVTEAKHTIITFVNRKRERKIKIIEKQKNSLEVNFLFEHLLFKCDCSLSFFFS